MTIETGVAELPAAAARRFRGCISAPPIVPTSQRNEDTQITKQSQKRSRPPSIVSICPCQLGRIICYPMNYKVQGVNRTRIF
jgi:hypothetical protein